MKEKKNVKEKRLELVWRERERERGSCQNSVDIQREKEERYAHH